MYRMKFAVFGATSGTGRAFCAEALAGGHTIVALARDPDKLTLENGTAEVLRGDVLDRVAVEAAVAGCDAVFCTIGAKPRDPAGLCSDGTRNIVAAMERHGVRRLVCVTGCMVGHPPELMRGTVYRVLRWLEIGFIKKMVDDRRLQEQLVQRSPLNWTILRPPRLTDGAATGRYVLGPSIVVGPGAVAARGNVAKAALALLTSEEFSREGVAIFDDPTIVT
ncbi:MAG: NAD-dependent epimerase/dehydratase family protein [Gammaproteobacteria bacterium]|nr:NAD-dependent epimerase/dehydratase family protein [Gammaproteobacteria bacterium]